MVVKELEDPGAFLEATAQLLLEDEARNNLILGIAGTLAQHPSVYPDFRLWLVEDTAARSRAPRSRHRATISCSVDLAMTMRSCHSRTPSRLKEPSSPG